MAINEEDLKFIIDLIPGDRSDLKDAIEGVARDMEEKISKSVSKSMIEGMSEAGKSQTARSKINEMFRTLGEKGGGTTGGTYYDEALPGKLKDVPWAKKLTDKEMGAIPEAKPGNVKAWMAKIFGGGGGGGGNITKLLGGILGGQGGGGTLGQIGGMAGGALGGSVGAMIGKMIAKKVPEMIAGPAKKITDSFKTLASALSGLQQPLGPISAGFDLMSSALGKVGGNIKSIPVVGELLGPLVDSFTALPGIFKDIITTLAGFAAKASPGTWKQLEIAVDDVQGVIGGAFLPVLELMRDGIRLFGDYIANLLPNMQEMRSALQPLREAFDLLAKDFREYAADIGPLVRTAFLAAVRTVSTAIKALAQLFHLLTAPLRMLAHIIGPLFGSTKGRSSQGAAARQVKFAGFDEYERQLQTSAFQSPGQVTEKEVPGLIDRIVKFLEERFGKWLADWNIPALIQALAGLLPGGGRISDATEAARAAAARSGSTAAGVRAGVGALIGGGTGSIIGGMTGGK